MTADIIQKFSAIRIVSVKKGGKITKLSKSKTKQKQKQKKNFNFFKRNKQKGNKTKNHYNFSIINIFFRLYSMTTWEIQNVLPLYLISHLALKQGEHLAFYQ